MLIRCVIMLGLAASGLALAACAQTESAMLSAMAAQAAEIAATQAALASTQSIQALENAATQMADQAETGQAVTLPSSLPSLPPPSKGTLVIDTPTVLIIQYNGKRTIVVKNPYLQDQGVPQP
jgi:glucan biosynthesis protein